MLQVREIDFTTQMVWYCAVAHFRGNINLNKCSFWQQCFIFTHVSLHIV